jgi:hypothetical protein
MPKARCLTEYNEAMAWRHIENPLFRWVKTLDRVAASVCPDDLHGDLVMIASDYGGTGKRTRYRTNAFVYADIKNSEAWETARRAIRASYMADGRRMSYKGLSDRQRAEAVVPFLRAALLIEGLCLVTIVNKELRNLSIHQDDYDELRTTFDLRARWRDSELDEAVRVAHTVACLVAGLSQPGHNIYWISDEDELFANPDRHHDMGQLVSGFTSVYVRHTLGELGVGTTAIDEGDRWEEDLAAIADLVAGGIAETTNSVAQACGGRLPSNLAIEYSGSLSGKAELIARWLWTAPGALRRVALLFEKHPHGQYAVSKYEMLN